MQGRKENESAWDPVERFVLRRKVAFHISSILDPLVSENSQIPLTTQPYLRKNTGGRGRNKRLGDEQVEKYARFHERKCVDEKHLDQTGIKTNMSVIEAEGSKYSGKCR